jgi:hypothetical protein
MSPHLKPKFHDRMTLAIASAKRHVSIGRDHIASGKARIEKSRQTIAYSRTLLRTMQKH